MHLEGQVSGGNFSSLEFLIEFTLSEWHEGIYATSNNSREIIVDIFDMQLQINIESFNKFN